MAFKPEPPFQHGQAPVTAVLLCNLGTPEAPTAPALRRYLSEFLGDPRVVEIPRLLWWLILHGIILRVRPAKSARKYASIWTPEGSPLKVWTERQTQALQQALQTLSLAIRKLSKLVLLISMAQYAMLQHSSLKKLNKHVAICTLMLDFLKPVSD